MKPDLLDSFVWGGENIKVEWFELNEKNRNSRFAVESDLCDWRSGRKSSNCALRNS